MNEEGLWVPFAHCGVLCLLLKQKRIVDMRLYFILLALFFSIAMDVNLYGIEPMNDVTKKKALSAGTSLAIAPSGRIFAAGFENGDVRLCNQTGVQFAIAKSPAGGITSLSFSNDGAHLLSACKNDVRLWNTETFKVEKDFVIPGRRYMWSMLLLDVNNVLAIESREKCLVRYDIKEEQSKAVFRLADSKLRRSDINGDINAIAYCSKIHLCVATYWQEAILIDSMEWKEQTMLQTEKNAQTDSPAFSPSGNWVAMVAGEHCFLFELDGAKLKNRVVLPKTQAAVGNPSKIAISDQGMMAVAFTMPEAAKRSYIGVFDIKAGKWNRVFEACNSIAIYGIGFVNGEKHIAIISSDGEIKVFEVR